MWLLARRLYRTGLRLWHWLFGHPVIVPAWPLARYCSCGRLLTRGEDDDGGSH